MSVNYCKIDSLDLFNDLKSTNISFSTFRNIVANYRKLELAYIKDKNADLLKDLNKHKAVLFSYLDNCGRESIKKVAKLIGSLESEYGNPDSLDTFDDVNKNTKFIKVSYENGSWKITSEDYKDEFEFDKKHTPDAINCLVKLSDRLDEQEAAYALCHAKKAGQFVFAALPFVRTDFNDTPFETRYIKNPGTTLGPIERPSDAVYTTNMPVSRQMAAEEPLLGDDEVTESDVLVDETGELLPITLVTDDYVITSNENGIFSLDEVKENLRTGKWKKQAADRTETKLKKLEQDAAELMKLWKDKLILDESAQRIKESYMAKVDEAVAEKSDELRKAREAVEPRLKKIAAKIDSITFNDKESYQKLQKLRVKIDGMILQYQRPVKEYRRRAISNVDKVEELLEQARKYVSPRNLEEFQKNVVDKFFYYDQSKEQFDVALQQRDPRNEEMIQEQVEKLRKEIKTSQNNVYKDAAYNKLDDLLISGDLNFNQYNELSDLAEINAKQVMASLSVIEMNWYKEIKSGTLDQMLSKIKDFYNSIKNWVVEVLSFLTFQEKTSSDINEGLDVIIEGE